MAAKLLNHLGLPMSQAVNPFTEKGVGGTVVIGGFVHSADTDSRMRGQEKYRTAADILANISIVAAGLRFFLNLAGAPRWRIKPAEDEGEGKSSDAAKEAAEFFEEVLGDMDTGWRRIVRRSGMYRFYGFGIQEWTAKRREDGKIGLLDIEPRPQHTIERWSVDSSGTVQGVWQRNPVTGELLPIPRSKMLYLVDDMFTDNPEGLGVLRQVADPALRLKRYLQLQGMGFDRDMRGIPMGRAPLAEIVARVKNGTLKPEDAEAMLEPMRSMVQMAAKQDTTGFMLDSAPYTGTSGDGTQVSTAFKWGMEILSSSTTGFMELSQAINSLNEDMARILGVEGLLVGSAQQSGNRALAEDKSRNLYLSVNACVGDIADGVKRDILKPIWALNGFPDKLKPTIAVEDVAFKDAQAVASALSSMAMAGAVMAPDDPAINDVRDLLGISHAPESDPEMMGMLAIPGPPGGGSANAPNGTAQGPAGGAGAAGRARERRGASQAGR